MPSDDNGKSMFIGEAVFLLILLGAFISLQTYNDIVTHDGYSMPLGSMCYTGNTLPQCVSVQQLHNCPTGGDACIEADYYKMISIDSFSLGAIMVFIKLGLAKLFKRKITSTRVLQALIWGSTPLVLLFTGWEDFLYFVARKQAIPPDLSWLNNTGLFPVVDKVILHAQTATSTSLYIVMAIGFIITSTMIYMNMKVTQNAGLRTPI